MQIITTVKIAITAADLREFVAAKTNGRIPPQATLWIWNNPDMPDSRPIPVHEIQDQDFIEVEWTEEQG